MRPKRHLGQNFLTGSHFPTRIVDFVRPAPDEPILEIGPGEGALTGLLLNAGARVTAIEVDADLLPQLQLKFGANPAFSLIEADALRVDLCRLFAEGVRVRVVANLPYNIATPLLTGWMTGPWPPWFASLTLMFQKEVAERVAEKPGSKTYGILSVLLQAYYDISYCFTVDENAFNPPPKVKSGVIRCVRNDRKSLPCNEKLFKQVVKMSFNQRRKTIRNSIKALIPAEHEENPMLQLRPERLGVEEFIELTNWVESQQKPA